MSRMPLSFECQGRRCGATLDTAPGSTGLLIVSGGNEIRAGAFNGQARLAADIAAAGFPVFRYDRRGIGDSEGENRGFRKARKDIAAALASFGAMAPQLSRIVGFGNCDAASSLMLFGGAGCDALVLSNPWAIEENASSLPPSAIRSRYAARLKDPRELKRLLTGGVDLRKLAGGLRQAGRTSSKPSGLLEEMRAGLADFAGPVRILLADNDRTAQHFTDAWDAADPRVRRIADAGHSYASPEAHAWLRAQLLEVLRG